ncbi:unnamed protein product [Penicillium pancosmium]
MTVADEYTTTASDILDAKSTIQILAATCRGIVRSYTQESLTEEKPRNVFPLYYYGENGIRKLRTPSPNERLSDQVVFAIIQGEIGGMCRGKIWPNDFDSDGHIKRDRIPRGPSVISWANGIPFFTVYGGYYILGGDYLAQRSWLLSAPSTSIYPGCLAGLVIASPSAIQNDVMLQSEQIHAFQMKSWKEINWQPKTDLERTQKNFTTYTKDHSRLSLIFFGEDSFGFVQIREATSYHLHLDPAETTTVSPTRVAIGVWNETRLERYVNNRNVQFHFPIQKFPLFFDEALGHPMSKTQSTLETPLKNLILESKSPKKKDPVTPVTPKIYNEILRDRDTLNTSPARAIIQLHKTQHDKHSKYRDLLQFVQNGIGGKDRAVKLIFQDQLAGVAFPDGDRVYDDKDKGGIIESDLFESSDVSLDLSPSPSPTPAPAGSLALPTPISIDDEEDVD